MAHARIKFDVLISLLLVYCAMQAMEAPPAAPVFIQEAIPSPPTPPKNPGRLQELAAKTLIYQDNFPACVVAEPKAIAGGPDSDIDELLKDELLKSLEVKFCPIRQEVHGVTSARYNSTCKVLPGGKYFICYQKNPLKIDIFNLEKFYSEGASVALNEHTTTDYNEPLFEPGIKNSSCLGALYLVQKKWLNKYNILETAPGKFTIEEADTKLERPLPGKVKLITNYKDSLAITVINRHHKKHQYIFCISKYGKVSLITEFRNKSRICALEEGLKETLVVSFRDRSFELFDPKKNLHTPIPLNPPYYIPGKFCNWHTLVVSPDRKIICVGFVEGTLTLYNMATKQSRGYTVSPEYYFSAFAFINPELLVASRVLTIKQKFDINRPAEEIETNVVTELWHLGLFRPIARFRQLETHWCNSIDIYDNHLAMGMGRDDATLQTLDSFTILPHHIKLKKIYKDPEKFLALLQKDKCAIKKIIEHYRNDRSDQEKNEFLEKLTKERLTNKEFKDFFSKDNNYNNSEAILDQIQKERISFKDKINFLLYYAQTELSPASRDPLARTQ